MSKNKICWSRIKFSFHFPYIKSTTRIFEELFESLRLGVHFFIRSYFWMIIYQLWIIFYFKTQVLSSYNRRFKFKSIWLDEPCWRIRNNRMTSKAFEIRNVYRKRGKAREYKEKRGEKILCMMAPKGQIPFFSNCSTFTF